jgi:phosphoribosyl-AMP cyclohydrolase
MNVQPKWLQGLTWSEDGLLPVIAQDAVTGEVLMFAWMNAEALAETARTGDAVYYSRSRQRLWRKGESSGHVQKVREIRVDCDRDVLLLSVEQIGGIACHTGRRSCFYLHLNGGEWEAVSPVLKDPKAIYGDG